MAGNTRSGCSPSLISSAVKEEFLLNLYPRYSARVFSDCLHRYGRQERRRRQRAQSALNASLRTPELQFPKVRETERSPPACSACRQFMSSNAVEIARAVKRSRSKSPISSTQSAVDYIPRELGTQTRRRGALSEDT